MTKTVKMNVNPIGLLSKNEMRKEVCSLQSQINLMKKLVTTKGFFEFYFSKLSAFSSKENCFDDVNIIYKSLFGQKRFDDYATFYSATLLN